MFYLAEKLLLTVLATRITNICIHLYTNLSLMHPSITLINYIYSCGQVFGIILQKLLFFISVTLRFTFLRPLKLIGTCTVYSYTVMYDVGTSL